MTDSLILALAQINPTVGDIAGNLAKLAAARDSAAASGADLVIASELVVSGYPPDDLVLKPAFQQAVMEAVATFAKTTTEGPAILLGAADAGVSFPGSAAMRGAIDSASLSLLRRP